MDSISQLITSLPTQQDSSQPLSDEKISVTLAKSLIKQCITEPDGLDKSRLAGLLERVITEVHSKTGVLPDAGIFSKIAAANNPTTVDYQAWDKWQARCYLEVSWMFKPYSHQSVITAALGESVGCNPGKIRALLQHKTFIDSLPFGYATPLTEQDLDYFTELAAVKNPKTMFARLFSKFEAKGIKPTGAIKAAIELGFMTEANIKKILTLP